MLAEHNRSFLFVYECFTPPLLPTAITSHPRVTLRSKRGALARTNQYYSFFDHIVQSYDSLAQYTLFLHLHDMSYHRLTPTRTIVRQSYELIDRISPRPIGYVNVGDAIVSTWTGCTVLQSATVGQARGADLVGCSEPGTGPCPSMLQRVQGAWSSLQTALEIPSAYRQLLMRSPLLDLNGAEALVNRCRLRARPMRVWGKLRDLSKKGHHHATLDYAIEGAFHFLMGEAWRRPRLVGHLGHLNHEVCFPSPAYTLGLAKRSPSTTWNRVYRKIAAVGAADTGSSGSLEPPRPSGSAWNVWRRHWRNSTELALTLRGVIDVRSAALSCDDARRKPTTARWWPWG